MKTKFLANERLIKKGWANLQREAESVGGRLFLTDQRLVFESHALNIQTGVTIIQLQQIVDTTPCWTRFLNLFPVFPNSLAVNTSSGAKYRFVLFGRFSWKDTIDAQRSLVR